MFTKVERLLAWRYLRPNKNEGFLSVITIFSFLGITLGVGTLIVVMAVMNGFHEELMAKILGFNGHISVYAHQGPLLETAPIIPQAAQLPEVRAVAPFIERQALVSFRQGAYGVRLHGLHAHDLQQRTELAPSFRLIAGDTADFSGPVIVLGKRLAEKLQVRLGDYVTLMNPQGQSTAFGLMPKSQRHKVVGIFDAGMSEYNLGYVFIPLAHAQSFYRLDSQLSGVEIFLHHIKDVKPVQQKLEGPYRLLNWQEANNSFFNAVKVERNMMFIILALLIVIAAFNIISGLTMLVKDKRPDIAILRTMGLSRGRVMRVFFLTGSTIGVAGTIAGCIWGVLFARNIESIRRWLEGFLGGNLFNDEIYYLTQLPAIINSGDVASVCGLALILSFLATLYPAWRASSLDPVEALRHG